jgi:D-glycero-beta-D-manno-heptose 1-phosphate adenylyltransferase
MIFKDMHSLWEWRDSFPKDKILTVSNGCFDLLHIGHLHYLENAKRYGDFLLVGINSDESVTQLKGQDRPINSELVRARMLDALKCVDAVYIFNKTKADDFLSVSRPNWYIKGGDYNELTIDRDEYSVLQKLGCKFAFIPFLNGFSTTSILNKIKK